eukprot:563591-Prorocentrum_minimum.AAC.1
MESQSRERMGHILGWRANRMPLAAVVRARGSGGRGGGHRSDTAPHILSPLMRLVPVTVRCWAFCTDEAENASDVWSAVGCALYARVTIDLHQLHKL